MEKRAKTLDKNNHPDPVNKGSITKMEEEGKMEEENIELGSIGTGEGDIVVVNSISPCPHIDGCTVLREDMVVGENDVHPYTVTDGSTCNTQEANIKCHPETALAVSTDAIKDGKGGDENIPTVSKVDSSPHNQEALPKLQIGLAGAPELVSQQQIDTLQVPIQTNPAIMVNLVAVRVSTFHNDGDT